MNSFRPQRRPNTRTYNEKQGCAYYASHSNLTRQGVAKHGAAGGADLLRTRELLDRRTCCPFLHYALNLTVDPRAAVLGPVRWSRRCMHDRENPSSRDKPRLRPKQDFDPEVRFRQYSDSSTIDLLADDPRPAWKKIARDSVATSEILGERIFARPSSSVTGTQRVQEN